MKLIFEIESSPQSFDVEDELFELLINGGLMGDLERAIELELGLIYGKDHSRFVVRYVNAKKQGV